MIVIYHNTKKIIQVFDDKNNTIVFDKRKDIPTNLERIAQEFPDHIIVWCNILIKNEIDLEFIKNYKVPENKILSYCPENEDFFPKAIGYVENSPSIKINKSVTYITWQMSSLVGFAHASIFIKTKNKQIYHSNFDFYLNNISRSNILLGLFCFSEPKLLKSEIANIKSIKATNSDLFKFVKLQLRSRWVFLLFLNFIIYENKFLIFSLIKCLFTKQIKSQNNDFSLPILDSDFKDTIDVLIPTIGRKKYLYDVLIDLKNQTHLPKNVIIIEQNDQKDSISELDYLTNQSWPFEIKHIFTHQTGACNSRNLGLDQLASNWCFLADDDVRFENNFLQKCLNRLYIYDYKAVTVACLQKGEVNPYKSVFQWFTFGTCSSIVRTDVLKNIRFGMGFEFGFGEDDDFGMKIRNQGVDIAFFNEPQMLHLKAPIGGFRTKFIQEWANDSVQPKPSPTIMLLKQTHNSKHEINGFRTTLFFKYYKVSGIKNPLKYFRYFNKQWKQSLFWANYLKNKNQ
ncbi:MAG: glycosyltransferase family 2 protein [Flavobacterium sp.]|nr:glycosyltransferase family 2 protein [Flavobacterium sp.]